MAFWKHYPVIKYIFSNDTFTSLIYDEPRLETHKYNVLILTHTATNEQKLEITQFLKQYFGNPPHTPTLDIPVTELLSKKDIIVYIQQDKIIGCIRYRYIGEFKEQEIYVEDCFCIHPQWRKKGIGAVILNALHRYVNIHNIPYSIFLKEGRSLNILHRPFYSGTYVYRKNKGLEYNNVEFLCTDIAYKIMDIFLSINDVFVIRNKESKNQYWRLYRKGLHKILVCFQDTYQRIQGEKIGWITGWFETPNIPQDIREEASIQLSESTNIFQYIWANKQWVFGEEWKEDGPFHWYLYQWCTNMKLGMSYCIMM